MGIDRAATGQTQGRIDEIERRRADPFEPRRAKSGGGGETLSVQTDHAAMLRVKLKTREYFVDFDGGLIRRHKEP